LNLESPAVMSSPPSQEELTCTVDRFPSVTDPHNGSAFVQRSVELGEPVICANSNYRVNALGWLAGGAQMSVCTIVSIISMVSDLPWFLTFNFPPMYPSGADDLGICQGNSSWPRSGLTFPSSATTRKRSPYDVFLSADHPPPPVAHNIAHTVRVQLGSECRSSLHNRPPHHKPRQPSVQGYHPRMSSKSKNLFGYR
jgi:hypothetical protein